MLDVLARDVGDACVEAWGWGLVAGGGVGSMVVVVDVPDRDRGGAFGLAGPDPGVEEFLGQGPVVALDLAVVAGGVGGVRWWREATSVTVRVNAVAL